MCASPCSIQANLRLLVLTSVNNVHSQIAEQIPEPLTLALLGIGLAGWRRDDGTKGLVWTRRTGKPTLRRMKSTACRPTVSKPNSAAAPSPHSAAASRA